MMQQRVDQSARGTAGGRVHDHAGRLVDHDQVVILVHHVERDGFGPDMALARLRHLNLDQVAAASGTSRESALSRRAGGSSPIRNESGSCPMDDSPPPVSPATLKFLARLVTVLTATMIVGVLVIVGLLVTRLQRDETPAPALPAEITLPGGATARAVTWGGDWYAVVTGDDRILIYDRASGEMRQTVDIVPS